MKTSNGYIRATGATPNLETLLDLFRGLTTRVRAKKKLLELTKIKASYVLMRNTINLSIDPKNYFHYDVMIYQCDREIRLLESILYPKDR